jgi:hypothetical protein
VKLAVAICWVCLHIFVCLCGPATPVAAQTATAAKPDRIWLAPSKPTAADSRWYPQAITTIVGRVVSLDNQQLVVLVTGDEVPTRAAAHRVIWIRPGAMSDKQSSALQLYADKDYGGAVRPLLDSLNDRPPVWRQQWLSMLAADAAWRSARSEIALELVAQLDSRPLAPYVLAWLPIAWQNDRQGAASMQAADKRLADKSAAVRLVAASWLLTSPSRHQAATVLKQLSADTARPAVAALARAVLWRTATPPQVNQHADAWQQQIDDLPIVLQTGPLVTLASRFESAGLEREAKQLKLSLELTPAIPYPISP